MKSLNGHNSFCICDRDIYLDSISASTEVLGGGGGGQAPINFPKKKSNMAAAEWQEIAVNLSFLGMLVDDMLCSGMQIQGVTSFVFLVEMFEARAGHNRTPNLWTDNIVKTVIIMMNFSRGGHEGNWVLHLLAAESMILYFRSAGGLRIDRHDLRSTHEEAGIR